MVSQKIVKWNSKISEKEIVQALEDIVDHINALREENIYIGVFCLELISSDEMLSVENSFITRLSSLMKRLNIYIVVDDIMCGIRCGEVFSYMLYQNFKPDFVVIGKTFMFGMVIAINKKNELKSLYKFSGFPECPIDPMLIRKTIEILRVVKKESLLHNARSIGNEMMEHLARLCTQFNMNSEQSQIATFGGVGCMWFTNLDLRWKHGDNVTEDGRLLPYITIDKDDLPKLIRSTGSLKYFVLNNLSATTS